MAGIEELNVSLTKNGYFKVARVLELLPASQVLSNLAGQIEGIKLDAPQIEKMLSGDAGHLPELWDEVRAMGPEAIRALTFISIIFSHHTLIRGFAEARTGEMHGVLHRVNFEQKTYTNLVHSMRAMGLTSAKDGAEAAPYTFVPLFRSLSIGPLAKRVFRLKLEKTGWREPEPSEIFLRNFYEQCAAYGFHETLAISQNQFRDWLEGNAVEFERPPAPGFTPKQVEVSASLVAALAAKPFVILSGPTGTGKTVTARQLASSLAPENVPAAFNHVFLPVEAGWTDGRHLLGYRNPFGKNGETYATTPLLDLIIKANFPDYAQIPFFIILDEMNLSPVEMYFSRFLSVMETSASSPESLVSEQELELLYLASMSDPVQAAYVKAARDRRGVFLTPNVFIIGTVNVDETTHMFSPKVLDRAFVLECPTQKPSQIGSAFQLPDSDRFSGDRSTVSEFLLTARQIGPDRRFDPQLDRIFSALGRFQFGPRVTSECHRYTGAIQRLSNVGSAPQSFADDASTLDRLTMQKILPKLHGNRAQVFAILEALKAQAAELKLLRSEQKLMNMQAGLRDVGFTNYFA